jgi:hypothetical protein
MAKIAKYGRRSKMTDIERLRKDIDQHKKMSFENAQKATEWAGCTQLERRSAMMRFICWLYGRHAWRNVLWRQDNGTWVALSGTDCTRCGAIAEGGEEA